MYNYINHSDEHFSPLLVALGTATEETPKLLHLEKDMLLYGSSYIFPWNIDLNCEKVKSVKFFVPQVIHFDWFYF